jgi:hypothetical protein
MVCNSATPMYLYGEQRDKFIFTYRLYNYSYFESFDAIEPNLSTVSFIKDFSSENLALSYRSAAFTCSAMS